MGVLDGIRCTPSRRSMKFLAGPHARHFFAFDSSISREDRMLLFMLIFAFYKELADREVLPGYEVVPYLPEELVEVRVVTDLRHPAYGQAGLYAKKAIPTNTIVTPYAGFIEIFGTSCNSRTYTMGFGCVSDDYALDAEFAGNYGRFANDPRGVEGLSANLSAENKFNSRGESYTALVARRQISEGEEILMAYGKAHSLSASPWVSVSGESLLRYRVGGMVPFPNLRTSAEVAAVASAAARRHHADGAVEDAISSSSGTDISLSYDVAWECAQCGMWNLGHPTVSRIAFCTYCQTAKLSGARMVAVLSSPPLTPEALRREVGPRQPSAVEAALRCEYVAASIPVGATATAPEDSDLASSPLSPQDGDSLSSSCERATAKAAHASHRRPPTSRKGERASTAAGSVTKAPEKKARKRTWENALQLAPSSFSTVGGVHAYKMGTVTASSPTSAASNGSQYASAHVDWPLNVPFLPWQVWDTAIPFSALAKHSKFDTHEHIFLYSVSTATATPTTATSAGTAEGGEDEEAEEEDSRSGSEGKVEGVDGNSLITSSEISEQRSSAERSPPPPLSSTASRQRGTAAGPSGKAARTEGVAGAKSTARSTRTTSASSSAPTTAARARRVRRREADLWKKNTDGDELPIAPPPLSSLSASGPVASAGDAAANLAVGAATAADSVSTTAATSLPPYPTPATAADDGAGRTPASVPTTHSSVGPTPAPPLLSAVLQLPREVDRFLLLRSGNAEAVARQLDTVRCSLLRMTRRIFSGKSFQPGEVVAYVGGVVRRVTDTRCRPDHSPMELPMKYLLPTSWRRRVSAVRGPTQVSGCSEGSTLERQGEAVIEDSARRLLQQLSVLSLVVTNEMMYCPCVAWEGEGRPDKDVQELLDACNVALVLTLDTLGSPFVAAVATRAIEAFHPLLARMQ